MAKRNTGVGKKKTKTLYKTVKRLEAKKKMLAEKSAKKLRHTRKINPTRYA